MGAFQGSIVRATPAMSSGTYVSAKPYIARRANGVMIDSYASVREAQKPIEAAAGGKLLVWVQDVRIDGIESYSGSLP